MNTDAQDIQREQMLSVLTDILQYEFKNVVPERWLLNQRTEEQVEFLESEYGTSMDVDYAIRLIESKVTFSIEKGVLLTHSDDIDECECECDYNICTECHDPDCDGCNN